MQIAFYAPLKSPEHPRPSGDRRMARLLASALERAGHRVALASQLRTWEGTGDAMIAGALRRQGEAETQRLLAYYRSAGAAERPDLWFTYHVYHKAPDWIGPAVAGELGIPYVIAEPSYAPKRAGGAWDEGHRRTAECIRSADAVFCLTRHDMACVRPLVRQGAKLAYLPPFLDSQPFEAPTEDGRVVLASRYGLHPGDVWLLAVGMMRAGDKLESYRRLAEALRLLGPGGWRLLIVGDGEARFDVEEAMRGAGPVSWLGMLSEQRLRDVYAASDIYVWPAVNEAYGMAILEAQASGLPVVACGTRGVPDVTLDGESALLVPDGDLPAFAAAMRRLIRDRALRQRMSGAARRFVLSQRALEPASHQLDAVLSELVAAAPA